MFSENDYIIQDVTLNSDDWKDVVVELTELISIMNPTQDPSIYTDDTPDIAVELKDSPILFNVSKLEKKFKVSLDLQCKKTISDILYTKVHQLLSHAPLNNSFKHNLRHLTFQSQETILYPY